MAAKSVGRPSITVPRFLNWLKNCCQLKARGTVLKAGLRDTRLERKPNEHYDRAGNLVFSTYSPPGHRLPGRAAKR